MTTKKILIGTSFLVFMLGITVEPQTPTPTPAGRECDVPTTRQVDKKLKILAKPDPKFSNHNRDKYRRQAITLRATFCGSGKVTDIVAIGGLNAEMDAAAIEAARLIQFTPAEKDGKKVSQVLTVKYFVK